MVCVARWCVSSIASEPNPPSGHLSEELAGADFFPHPEGRLDPGCEGMTAECLVAGRRPIVRRDGATAGRQPFVRRNGDATGRRPIIGSDGSATGGRPAIRYDGAMTRRRSIPGRDGAANGVPNRGVREIDLRGRAFQRLADDLLRPEVHPEQGPGHPRHFEPLRFAAAAARHRGGGADADDVVAEGVTAAADEHRDVGALTPPVGVQLVEHQEPEAPRGPHQGAGRRAACRGVRTTGRTTGRERDLTRHESSYSIGGRHMARIGPCALFPLPTTEKLDVRSRPPAG